ncbi:hypothetical protein AC622_11900 [Bacillus sp. FJAT-27916]|uniref:hypothetical protein n=1 Tax=Bacillaceae TaxID=186817 RepID=UPI00067117BE|nr:hypothetical protein [Bacillus sp. FJAT-27916]KMY44836.1 hypothetical protein AC622_11900 [Bacillus sp. FJAT-27916]
MDWNLFASIAIAVFLIRWDQKRLTLFSLCRELSILALIIFLLSQYLEKARITFSPFSHIPDSIEVWIAACILSSFVLCLFHKGWQSFMQTKTNK